MARRRRLLTGIASASLLAASLAATAPPAGADPSSAPVITVAPGPFVYDNVPGSCGGPAAPIPSPVTITGDPTPTVRYHVYYQEPTMNHYMSFVTSDWPVGPWPATTVTMEIQATNTLGSDYADVSVTVRDVEPPTLGPVSNVTVDATSPTGAVVTFPLPSIRDNCVRLTSGYPKYGTVSASPSSGSTFPIGSTTVTVTGTDNSWNQTTKTFTVHVRGAAEQLATLRASVVGVGPGASLAAKLGNAAASLAAGRPSVAGKQLQAFINEVQAQAGKKLTAAQAAGLVAAAERIVTVIG